MVKDEGSALDFMMHVLGVEKGCRFETV